MENDNNNVSYSAPYADEAPKKEKKKKKHIGWKIFFILLLCCLIGFPAYYGGKTLYHEYGPAYQDGGMKGLFNSIINGKDAVVEEPETPEEPVAVATPAPAATPKAAKPVSDELSEEEIFADTVDSMVSITTTVEGYNFFGQRVQGAASGSGFVVTDDGYILTNYHVVSDSTAISVNFYNGDTYDAELVGYDAQNDVAVLKIDATGLQPVALGDSDALKEGQHVVAIGNALGQFSFSITNGIVSGLARDIQVSNSHSMSLIQISCAINSGNSGGALLNMKGEVVGITNAKYGSSGYSNEASVDNIGFAIPINSVEKIFEDIINKGYIEKTYIGISVFTVSEETASALGIDGGVIVGEVTKDAPADKAGLKEDDIIVAANGKNVLNSDDLVEYISTLSAGDEVELSIYRKAKAMDITVTVEAQAQSATPNEDAAAEAAENQPEDFEEYYGKNGKGQNDPYGNYGSNSWMEQFFKYYFG